MNNTDNRLARPRLLVLTPRFPYPVVGGDRLRIFQLCKALSSVADLTLLSLCESPEEMSMAVPADGVFQRAERVFLSPWRSRLNALMALPTRTPLQVAYYRSREFAQRIDELLPSHDLVLAHLIRTGDYVRAAALPRILEMTDAISLNYQRVQSVSSSHRDLRSLVYAIEARRLLAYERQIIGEFDRAVLVSEVDRQHLLQGRDDPRVLVYSNGVDLEHLGFKERVPAEPVVVFIGNMTTVQNMDACMFFAAEVLPLMRTRHPFRFRVIGRIDPKARAALERFEGVEVRANVDSISQAVEGAYAGVAPMRLGAGIQNKVLEYMALGLPAVVSSVGLEGLKAVPGRDLLVASEPTEMSQALISLWHNTEQRLAVAKAGRRYVESTHIWEAMLRPLLSAVSELGQAKRV
jgi:glycosyltransferase involved in cell wall biosynthesis